jgi:type I restriction enzyme S subunit
LAEGTFPVIDQGARLIGGYANDSKKKSLAPLPVVVFGDHTRAIKYFDRPFIQGADGVRILCAAHGVDPLFAYHSLRCVQLPDKGYSRHFRFLKATQFPLAPLSEQRRIVAKIDSLSAKSRRARENLEHVPRLVEKYKQAVLTAAFRGDLSREWRKQNGVPDDRIEFAGLPSELTGRLLPKDWTKSSIEEAAVNHDGKRVPVRASDRAKRKGAFPYYGASGIIDTIDDYLFDGDFVLIGEDGANLVSRSTPIAFLATGRFWVNNDAHILKAGPDTSNQWLCWFINMIDLVPYVTGSAQPKLTQAALNRVGIPLPSIIEQQEILRRIEIAFAWIDRLASETSSARKLINHLDQAILARAFRGELVPQDLNDEPASVLLDRVRAQRASAPKAKRKPRSDSRITG